MYLGLGILNNALWGTQSGYGRNIGLEACYEAVMKNGGCRKDYFTYGLGRFRVSVRVRGSYGTWYDKPRRYPLPLTFVTPLCARFPI